MSRPYTGTSDGIATGRRPGLEAFVAAIQSASGGQLWNNGTYGIRKKRGKSSISVHSTGRAADLSRRKYGSRPGCSRAVLEQIIDWLVSNADVIGLELLIDYEPRPGGRGWKCDREDWQTYKAGTVSGAPGGDWIHIELDPAHADSTDWLPAVIATFPIGTPPAPLAPSTDYPGASTRKHSRAAARVRQIQQRLAELGYKNSTGTSPLAVDGDFGNATDSAVRAFQMDNSLTVDGIVGPATWAHLFG